MKRSFLTLSAWLLLILLITSPSFAQTSNELKIDPLLLVSLKECQNIMQSLGNEIFPGWDFGSTPVLFYKPKVQELLINFPHQPEGFSSYTGFTPLEVKSIYVRNDSTHFLVDDQNTSIEIDSIPVLVVADPLSRMRNQMRGVLTERPKDFLTQWLDNWDFVESPYQELFLILHEAFHVHQDKKTPEKGANEMIVSKYPLLDPINNAFYVLEGNILRDALLSPDPQKKLEKIKELVAVRSFRQSRLDSSFVEYENLTEYSEGLARYVEYKFMCFGERIEPVKEMYYHQGFNGYRGVLEKLFEDRVNDMVKVVSVSDDRFGNKFGSGPLRFKLYDLGAFQALLLDEVMPTWKDKIFSDGVYLGDMLKQSMALSPGKLEQLLTRAKLEYNYDEAYQDKLQFEQEGKKKIEEKLASIVNTNQTLVKVLYAGFTEKLGIAYTPFGVTQVSEKSAIYDMVPIKIRFKEGVELQFRQVIPVLVDKENKMIEFAVPTPISDFGAVVENKLETPEFILSTAIMDITPEGNTMVIRMK